MLFAINTASFAHVEVDGTVEPVGQAPQVFCQGHATACSSDGKTWTTAFRDTEWLRVEIAAAYAQGHADPGGMLDGSFSYIMLDPVRRLIVAGCDPLGKCRLFYAWRDPSVLVLATSLELLLAEVGGHSIDEEYVADCFTRSWHLGGRTPFVGCGKLTPGEVLRWPDRRITRNWWDGWRPEKSDLRTASDYADRLRQILQETVAASIVDVPPEKLGCELSGGLDSSTVYAIARQRGPVMALSYVYPQSGEADERRYIEAALGTKSASWFPIDADAAAPFTAEFPVPLAEPANALIYAGWIESFAAAAAKTGVSTILTGLGGDSILLGDRPAPFHIADLLRTGRWRSAIAHIQMWRHGSAHERGFGHWLLEAGVIPLKRWATNRLLAPGDPPPPWINHDYARGIAAGRRDERRDWPRQPTVAETQQLDGVRRAIHGISTFYAPQSSVSFRHPLLSVPLIAFMRGLPTSLRLTPDCDRLLQRHAMAGVLPDLIRLRTGKGGPTQAIFAGLARNRHWQERLCDDPIIARRGYVDRERWRSAVRLFVHGETRSLRLFLATAILETWFQQLPTAWSRSDQRRQFSGTAP